VSGSRTCSRFQSLTLGIGLSLGLGLLVQGLPQAVVSAAKEPAARSNPSHTNRGEKTSEKRRELVRELSRQIRAGDLVGARETAIRYLSHFPGDGTMTYNLACLESRLANSDAAWLALQEAFALGFTDLRLMATDPDLEALRQDEHFAAWLQDCRKSLSRRARAHAMTLREGYWSENIELVPNDGSPGDNLWPQVSIKMRYSEGGLGISAQVQASQFNTHPQPWRHGDGFLVNIVIPPENESFESQRFFSFGFGLVDNQPVGVFIGRHGERLDQRVVQLDPKIRFLGDDTASYSLQIPWQSVAPYAPPLDSLLGVNVCYLSVGRDRMHRSVSLVPDPHPQADHTNWRRFAPVNFRESDRSSPVLRGRVTNSVVGSEPISLELLAWVPTTGQGKLSIQIQDIAGRSVVESGPANVTVPLTAGLNRWERFADLAALPSGPFLVKVQLALSEDQSLWWQTSLLRLRDNWYEIFMERLAALRPEEQPSVQFRLKAVSDALTHHHPRDDPSAIGTTLTEAGLLVQRAEKSSTILPASGPALVALPGRRDQWVLCSLFLPVGFQPDATLQLLVLLADPSGSEANWARHIGDTLPEKTDLVVLVPHLNSTDTTQPDDILLDIAATIAWGQSRFRAGPALLVAMDSAAEDAMHFSLRYPELCQEILLMVTATFEPWPGRDQIGLQKLLAAQQNQISYTIADLPGSTGGTGQAQALSAALRESGFQVRDLTTADETETTTSVGEHILHWLP